MPQRVGLITDAFGARWGMGVSALAGLLSFVLGYIWLLRQKRRRSQM